MPSNKAIYAIDEPRRIVLPTGVWRAMNWDDKTPLEIWISPEGGEVVLKPHNDVCVFCGATDGLKQYNVKYICAACQEGITKI